MRHDHITYWQCPKCRGVGKLAPFWSDSVETCFACDGTGNALVDGEAEMTKRRIAEREARNSNG